MIADERIDIHQWLQERLGKQITDTPSGFGKWLNMHLIEANADRVMIEVEARAEMSNPMGLLHGGLMAGIMDEIIGLRVASLNLPDYYITVNLHTDFLEAIPIGTKARAQASVVRQGCTMIFVEAQVLNEKGVLCAKANSHLLRYKPRPILEQSV